jgi:hypothetical protein
MQFKTPVLFIIFNRPGQTQRVFEQIRQLKPLYLFIAADGPRKERDGEDEICKATRDLIIHNIDWPCTLKTLFNEENFGCGKAVSSAITWFFENVEEGIVLEDDCLPHPSFFNYCELMLDRYRGSQTVLHITGCNMQQQLKWGKGSYFFSVYPFIWGWAGWRRTWQKYDYHMKVWPQAGKRVLERVFNSDAVKVDFWYEKMEMAYQGKVDTWDYQYVFAFWLNGGVSVNPNVNLISNIGFGKNATHTKAEINIFSEMELHPYLRDTLPGSKNANTEADEYLFNYVYLNPGYEASKTSLLKKWLSPAWRLLRKITD